MRNRAVEVVNLGKLAGKIRVEVRREKISVSGVSSKNTTPEGRPAIRRLLKNEFRRKEMWYNNSILCLISNDE